jgi:DNA-binding PadR family transcriptional regulator
MGDGTRLKSWFGDGGLPLSLSLVRYESMCCKYIHGGYRLEGMTDDIDSLLPLQPMMFHILLSLADEDRHGYAIILDVARRTNGEIKLSAGTLYRSIQRMLEMGLITETKTRPAPEMDDERRRYYRITAFGTAVARAEAGRLRDLLKMARLCGVEPRTTS